MNVATVAVAAVVVSKQGSGQRITTVLQRPDARADCVMETKIVCDLTRASSRYSLKYTQQLEVCRAASVTRLTCLSTSPKLLVAAAMRGCC